MKKTSLKTAETNSHCVALTFERGIQHSLFDLGFLYDIGSSLGENELSRPWLETIPVIFNHRDAVLQTGRRQWVVFDAVLPLIRFI